MTGVKVPATQRKTMTVITSVPNTNNNSTQSATSNVDAVLDDDESDPNLLIYPSNCKYNAANRAPSHVLTSVI